MQTLSPVPLMAPRDASFWASSLFQIHWFEHKDQKPECVSVLGLPHSSLLSISHFLSTLVPENSSLLLTGPPMPPAGLERAACLGHLLSHSLLWSCNVHLLSLPRAHLIQAMRGLLHPQLSWLGFAVFFLKEEAGGWRCLFLLTCCRAASSW